MAHSLLLSLDQHSPHQCRSEPPFVRLQFLNKFLCSYCLIPHNPIPARKGLQMGDMNHSSMHLIVSTVYLHSDTHWDVSPFLYLSYSLKQSKVPLHSDDRIGYDTEGYTSKILRRSSILSPQACLWKWLSYSFILTLLARSVLRECIGNASAHSMDSFYSDSVGKTSDIFEMREILFDQYQSAKSLSNRLHSWLLRCTVSFRLVPHFFTLLFLPLFHLFFFWLWLGKKPSLIHA